MSIRVSGPVGIHIAEKEGIKLSDVYYGKEGSCPGICDDIPCINIVDLSVEIFNKVAVENKMVDFYVETAFVIIPPGLFPGYLGDTIKKFYNCPYNNLRFHYVDIRHTKINIDGEIISNQLNFIKILEDIIMTRNT